VSCSIIDSLSVQLIKYVNEMPVSHTFQVSQLLINSHKLKHEVTGNSLLILYIFNVLSIAYHNELSFIHWTTKNYNFNNTEIVEFFCQILLRFRPNFQQIKTFGGAAAPPAVCTPSSCTSPPTPLAPRKCRQS